MHIIIIKYIEYLFNLSPDNSFSGVFRYHISTIKKDK